MGWRDNLVDASFRGIPFLYEKVEGEIGRRTALKEYPGRDKPSIEDLGRATRKFTIDMFVIGDNYDFDRDQLRTALEKAGSGELEHPYWGKMTVTLVGTARVTESTKQGGMAKFTATFVEGGSDNLKQARLELEDTAEVVTRNAEALEAAAESRFAKLFAVINAIASVAAAAIEAVNGVAHQLDDIRSNIAAVLAVVDEAKAAIEAVVEGVEALILAPVNMAKAVKSMIAAVTNGVASIGTTFNAAVAFFGGEDTLPAEGNVIAARSRVDVLLGTIKDLSVLTDGFPAPSGGTAQQQGIKDTNQEALSVLVKSSAISSVSAVAVQLDYESYDQAQQTRTAITNLIDDLLADDQLTDDIYGPLVNLRASLVKHFAQVANSLPELTDYIPQQTVPALVLAYRLYGTAGREPEILVRNPRLRDPSAVPGGQSLKVLLDA